MKLIIGLLLTLFLNLFAVHTVGSVHHYTEGLEIEEELCYQRTSSENNTQAKKRNKKHHSLDYSYVTLIDCSFHFIEKGHDLIVPLYLKNNSIIV